MWCMHSFCPERAYLTDFGLLLLALYVNFHLNLENQLAPLLGLLGQRLGRSWFDQCHRV